MDLNAVGARIKAAREAKGLTQEKLAEIIGKSTTHISVIERGCKAPKLETFVQIANALDVSADSLLLDVVDHSNQSIASDLSAMIEKRPKKEQQRIMNAVRALLTEE